MIFKKWKEKFYSKFKINENWCFKKNINKNKYYQNKNECYPDRRIKKEIKCLMENKISTENETSSEKRDIK